MRGVIVWLAVILGSQTGVPPRDASAIAGIWKGTARTASCGEGDAESATCQTTDVAFEIQTLKNGVGLFMTLPPLHAWGMPVGYLEPAADGGWQIPDWHVRVRQRGGSLVGELGDPRVTFEVSRDSAMPAEAPLPTYPDGPAPDWTYDAGAPIWAPVAALEGIAYAADAHGTVHAVHVSDGSRAWTRDLGAPLYAAPVVTSQAVYALDDSGTLHKLARQTGRTVWRAELGADPSPRVLPASDVFEFDFHSPAPVIRDGIIYIPSSAGVVHAIDEETGRTKWKTDLKARVRAGLGVSDALVFAGTLGNDLVALDRTSGAERWRVTASGPLTSAPQPFGDLVLFANRGSWLTAVESATGKPRWARYDWFSWIESDGVFADNIYYVGSSDLRMVRALDPRSGKLLWEADVLGWAWGTPAITRDVIYAGIAAPQKYITKHSAGLVALDRRTGRVLWRHPVPPAASFVSGYPGSVAVEGDVLVAPNVSGVLEGYKTGTRCAACR
jgi:outer membrane protein assembly factor BamB